MPEPDLPMSRASLPEGCSDIVDAYRVRSSLRKNRDLLLLRVSAELHDPFVAQVDPSVLRSGDQMLLNKKISDFFHPILLARPELENQIRPSSDLVDTMLHVVLANIEGDET